MSPDRLGPSLRETNFFRVEPLGVAQRWAGVEWGLDVSLLKALGEEKPEAGHQEPN